MFVALIADVSRSRRILDKTSFQKTLWSVAKDETRERFSDDLATKVEVTAWDEWEGVLAGPARAWELITFWSRELESLELSVGIGIGSLEGSLDPDPRKVTGEAFYLARDALARAKSTNSMAYFAGPCDLAELNLVVLLWTALYRRLTARQLEVIQKYRQLGTMEAAADALGVTQQNVSQVLRAGEYQAIAKADQYIRERLRNLGEEWSQ